METMAWIYLVMAGLLEVGWAVGLKYTEGFSRPGVSVTTIIAMIASFGLLSVALKTIPVGTGDAASDERHRSKANKRASEFSFSRAQSRARLAPIIAKLVPLAP